MDVRLELKITQKSLCESKLRIKQMLLEAADGQLYKLKAIKK